MRSWFLAALLLVCPVFGTALGWLADPLDDWAVAASGRETVSSSGWTPRPTG
jgi:hypothetical protein